MSVDEREVDLGVFRQRRERLSGRSDAKIDPVGDAGFVPEGHADRRPLVADVARDERRIGAKFLGHDERRVPGENADLDHCRRIEQAGKHRHEASLREPDLHAGVFHRLRLVDESLLEV